MKYTNNYTQDVCWRGIRVEPGQTVSYKHDEDLKTRLKKMKMNELRDFVKNKGLKASDTSKKELLEEIFNELNL